MALFPIGLILSRCTKEEIWISQIYAEQLRISHQQLQTQQLQALLCALLQIHNPVQHNLIIRRIPIHGKVGNPHGLEPHAFRSCLLAGFPVLCWPGSPTTNVLKAHLNHGIGEDILRVRVDIVEEVAGLVVIGIVRLEQRVEKTCLCLDRTVMCGAVTNPLDKARRLSGLGDHEKGSWYSRLGLLGRRPVGRLVVAGMDHRHSACLVLFK